VNNRSFSSAFLTAILICGLILVSVTRFVTVHASTDASSIPKPSVPEFTVELVDSSYDVPTTYSTDPYTGETVTHEGYHVGSKTIEVTIKNQPFVPFWIQENPSVANWTINFYYNVRIKGHFSEDWKGLYYASDGYPSQDSGSEYTVLSYQGRYSPTEGMSFQTSALMTTFPVDAQIDFQVEAMIGYVSRVYNPDATEQLAMWPWRFTGETSGWSNTQTITIPTTPSPTTSPTPTPAPTPIQVPGQSAFSVESNSTVSELFFNSTSSELSFTVSGEPDTAGYVKVTIAKNLVSSVQNAKAYLDGSQLEVAITEDEDSWLLSFNYLHSTHHVRVSLAANAAATTFLGTELLIGVVVIVVVVGVCLLFYFKKRNR